MDKLGHNDLTQTMSIRSYFIPSLAEFSLWFVVSIIGIIILNIPFLWSQYFNNSVVNDPYLYDAWFVQLEITKPILAHPVLGDFATWITWLLIGSIAYTIVWFIQHFYARFRGDLTQRNYAANNLMKQNYMKRVFKEYTIIVAAIVILIVSTFGIFLGTLPYAARLARAPFINPTSFRSYLTLVTGITLFCVALYVYRRIVLMTTYIFRSQLSDG